MSAYETAGDFYAVLAAHAPYIKRAASKGDKDALEVMRLYEMHRTSPNDPGALGLCMAALDAWKQSTEARSAEVPQ